MRILFLPMDKHKTISILRVNQIDGSETIRNRDNKLYGRVKMKVHNQFLLSGVAAIAMLANAAPAMAQAAPAAAAPVAASAADARAEERRVGNECVSTCGSRWSRAP